jgi:hypothetical protein
MHPILQDLLASAEPSIRFKLRTGALGEPKDSPTIRDLRLEIKASPRVRTLLAERDRLGRIEPVDKPYNKWYGAHWVLAALADLGYPTQDPELIPVRDQVFDCWLQPEGIEEHVFEKKLPARRGNGVPIIQGRARRCASQQGNALYAAVALGLVDDRCQQLAGLLIHWQWPDGGWNCDRRPEASTSSFWESLIPLRALSIYARTAGDRRAGEAAACAAELFLKRGLFRRLSDGEIMNPGFLRLHYPCYWRYDILFALKVMSEAGFITDPRCAEALDILTSKRLPDGGWPAEARFYSLTRGAGSYDRVSWGGVSQRRLNEWVTADALSVLAAAGRVNLPM